MTAPATHATTETDPCNATTMSGIVMSGPAPIIVTTLIATALRSPTPRIISAALSPRPRVPWKGSLAKRCTVSRVNEYSRLLGLDGTLHLDRIESPALAGNALGDPANRPVAVYTPPGYDAAGSRRYPVLYCLHGYTGDVGALIGTRPWET